MRPIDADEAKRIAREYLTDPYHVISAVAVIDKTPTLTPQNEAEKAIQRMGIFGKLFLDYSGDPRGQMGKPGDSTDEEWATMMDPIQDVEGEWWRPVQEQALQNLICKIKSLEFTQQNEPLTIEQLREMDGEPVWLGIAGGVWGLIDTDGDCVWLDRGGSIGICKLAGRVYRRPPERQEAPR